MKQELQLKLGYYFGVLVFASIGIFGARFFMEGQTLEFASFLSIFASFSIGWVLAVWINEWIGDKRLGAFVSYSAPLWLLSLIGVELLSDDLMPFLVSTDAALGFALTQITYWSNIRPSLLPSKS